MAMAIKPICCNDGAGYDRFMGVWSRLAGQELLRGSAQAKASVG
jgi:hypothetical protein